MPLELPPLLRRTVPFVALSVLCLLALPAHAQWKWRDKDGRVTVSDRPPPRDIPDKDIMGRPAADLRRTITAASVAAAASAAAAPLSGASAAEPAKSALDREVEARKRSAEQELAARAKAEETRVAAQRADNCQRARIQQTTLDSGQRIARVNDKGEREVLDDKARSEEMRRAREVIASECR